MNDNPLVLALTEIRDAFPRQPFGDGAVRVYAEQLADLPGDEVLAATRRLLRTSSWAPTIAEIRYEAAEAMDPLPTVEQAWDQAQAGATRVPLVRESVEAVGGFWEILHGQNMIGTRKHFRDDYTARRAREMRGRAGGEPVRAAQLKAGPVSLNGHRMKQIPESTRIQPRPVAKLMALRYAGHPPELPPSTDERHDAILILQEGPQGVDAPGDDPLYREAEDVFRRASDIA